MLLRLAVSTSQSLWQESRIICLHKFSTYIACFPFMLRQSFGSCIKIFRGEKKKSKEKNINYYLWTAAALQNLLSFFLFILCQHLKV